MKFDLKINFRPQFIQKISTDEKSVFFTSPKILPPTPKQNSLKIPNTEIFHLEMAEPTQPPNKASHTHTHTKV